MAALVGVIGVFAVISLAFFLIPLFALGGIKEKFFLFLGFADGLVLGAYGLGGSLREFISNKMQGVQTDLTQLNWGVGVGTGLLALIILGVALYFAAGKVMIATILGAISGICAAATPIGDWANGLFNNGVDTTVMGTHHLVTAALSNQHLVAALPFLS